MRLEGISTGGYFPTPPRVVGLIAGLFTKPAADSSMLYSYADPCAGEGSAILEFIAKTTHGEATNVVNELYSIEMESSRHETLSKEVQQTSWRSKERALNCDAFLASWKKSKGVGVLWLNPPYDFDPVHGRLEEKFLTRFSQALSPAGVLIFIVPFHALKASAKTIAKSFDRVECYKFPEPEIGDYKQVVLLASKRETDLWDPDQEIEARVLSWAASLEGIQEIPDAHPTWEIPNQGRYSESFKEWKAADFDIQGLLDIIKPWSVTDRSGKINPIHGILPEGSINDLLVRHYPVAMPPRSAHIAAGIAAGVFNGARIYPDNMASKFPPILVKGVFLKEFRTVDEKKDKDGNVKGVVQIQQPRLVTTILDLSTSQYSTVQPKAQLTDTDTVQNMTMADLLAAYGQGLMDVMLKQCPVLHDPSRPEDEIPLPELARPLFRAQASATQAAIKLLGGLGATKAERRFKSCFVLGEIGSGKSSLTLAITEALKFKRVLIMCPPHLLQSWQDQIKEVVPWFRVLVLSDVGDVQALAAMKDAIPTIAIMSRETAKLGHAMAPVTGRCGHCGGRVDPGVDHAKKRATCEHRKLVAKDRIGRLLLELSVDLLRTFPEDPRALQVIYNERLLKAVPKWKRTKSEDPEYQDEKWNRVVQRGHLREVTNYLAEQCAKDGTAESIEVLPFFVLSDPRPEVIIPVCRALYAGRSPEAYYSTSKESLARQFLLLLPQEKTEALVEELQAMDPQERPSYYTDPWPVWRSKQKALWNGDVDAYDYSTSHIKKDENGFHWGKLRVGDPSLVLEGLLKIAPRHIRFGKECGEPLYQSIPEPRRFPLATYIAKKHQNLFDFMVLDEFHEYSSEGAAQEIAAHRLTSLGIPTACLSGTIMNGYAESLFTNTWACSADFRREFNRDEKTRFIDRYGYRKRLVEDRDKESGKVVEYGSVTDRVERSERMIGNAPGVLPLFLLKYLLPISVTLHKADLGIDIPKCTDITQSVTPTDELKKNYEKLQQALVAQIRKDRFEPDRAGKLWGAMAELPSYLDMAVVGNTDSGRYEIRYPESVGGQLVAMADPFPSTVILPKEEWLLNRVETSLAEGLNVMVFVWHTALLSRISKLIEARTGEKCPILEPAKVPTKKRQEWIDKEIVRKKRRVMVVNPVTVQTGLNNLIYFSDQIWHENPACNGTILRQAVGRVDRIGQKNETRIFFPLYEGTAQKDLHSLLLHKVAISMSVDGLDAESALLAAGVGEDTGFSTFAVGRQLYEILTSGRDKLGVRESQGQFGIVDGQ